MDSKIKTPKKLIEVALPLDDINKACSREKSIRHGHPSTLHLWWARRPLAAARAVLFAQMVNDPGGERGFYSGKTKAQADAEREKLFQIIRELVQWKNSNNEEIIKKAQKAIRESWRVTCELNRGKQGFDPEKLPAFHDPFAGGGSIPLEAQRLGLKSYASDLNPVAVLINKAMIEIPQKFIGKVPVGPTTKEEKQGRLQTDWPGATGLAEDVQRYGNWMQEEAFKRIGHLYQKVEITPEMTKKRPELQGLLGQQLTVIAWLWTRTVKSPNPAFSHVDVPLASSFVFSTKKGKEAYAEPVVDGDKYSFLVNIGISDNFDSLKKGTKLSRGANFRCIISDSPIKPKYIKDEGSAGRMGAKLMAVVVVAEGIKGKIYLSPTKEMETDARKANPTWIPQNKLPNDPRNFWTVDYGLKTYGDLFTQRQLLALTTFSDLIQDAREKVITDAKVAGMPDDNVMLDAGGSGATAYGDVVGVYLSCAVGRAADYWTGNATWEAGGEFVAHAFTKQAIPMIWDFPEGNPFSGLSGSWSQTCLSWVVRVIENFQDGIHGSAQQCDAQSQIISKNKIISTDPPYYDNIAYADLFDYFYVWLRRSLKPIFPTLFVTIAAPKAEELVANPYRHGSKEKAEAFFMDGMTRAIQNIAEQAHDGFPVTIYYAFKQSETKDTGTVSTGWETFLEAVIQAGFAITGTWPIRTERGVRSIGIGTNALASSIRGLKPNGTKSCAKKTNH